MHEQKRQDGDLKKVMKKVAKMACRYQRLGLADIDDLVQDTMIRMLNRSSEQLPPMGWLSKAVASVAIDAARQARREEAHVWREEDVAGVHGVGECSSPDQRPVPHAQNELFVQEHMEPELMSRLQAILAKLDEHARVVLLLHVDGFSYAEIAQFTGAKIGTVRSRLSYGRKKAQRLLAGCDWFAEYLR
ncbi:MAG: RNA polymerase sigma factor [Candidatus Obscuribacterales bacterium]|nr:RNA polymerase sigma factor [Candidatus Obscuribacterales bacterium]